MSFEKLLGSIGELAKSQAASNETVEANAKIQAAAADGQNNDSQTTADTADGGTGLAGDGIDGADKNKDGKTGDKPMAKSFTLALEDGTQMEAFDGTELVKSLTDRLDATAGELAAEKLANAATQEQVMKSFEAAVDLLSKQAESIKEQGLMIKSLNEKVTALGNTGRGTKSVITVTSASTTPLTKSLGANAGAMSNQEILAKSLTAMQSGRISGLDATRIETSLNMGVAVPADLMSKISSN